MTEALPGLLAALASGIALGVAGQQFWALHRRLRHAEAWRRRDAAETAEALRLGRAQRQMEQVQRVAETAVGGGTEAVRLIHQGIAAIPFGILEAIPVTRGTTRVVRRTHDLIAGAVYGSIQAVNRGVGHGLRAGLKPRAAETDAERPED